MKDKRHIKSFNEHGENLNISDVISSKSFMSGSDTKFVNQNKDEIIKWLLQQQPKIQNYVKSLGQDTIFGKITKTELENSNIDELKFLIRIYKSYIHDINK